MTDYEELAWRARLEHVIAERDRLRVLLDRLLQHAKLPPGATSRTYSTHDTRRITVPARTLVSAITYRQRIGDQQ